MVHERAGETRRQCPGPPPAHHRPSPMLRTLLAAHPGRHLPALRGPLASSSSSSERQLLSSNSKSSLHRKALQEPTYSPALALGPEGQLPGRVGGGGSAGRSLGLGRGCYLFADGLGFHLARLRPSPGWPWRCGATGRWIGPHSSAVGGEGWRRRGLKPPAPGVPME